MKDILIIGGGITGLTAAYRLAKRGYQVAIFEKDSDLGGQAATFAVEGTRLESYYHHIFTGDREIMALIEDLGLSPRMRWLPSKVGIYYREKIYDFVTPADLLKFQPLGLFQRLKTGVVTLYLQRFASWRKLENVTALEWVERNLGQGPYEVIFRPLLRGKFGEYADRISMAWLWSKFKHRVGSRGRSMQRELLGYMEGSFQGLLDALAEQIRNEGGEIYTNSPVKKVVIESGTAKGLEVSHPDGVRFHPAASYVLATCPSFALLEMAEFPLEFAEHLRQVEYLGCLCLILEMNAPLSHIYWLNISDPSFPFVGAIEHTNLIPPENYHQKHLLYLTNYLSRHDPLYGLPPERVLERYLPFLKKINPGFREDWIEGTWIFHADAAQPIITCSYADAIPPHRTPIEGLYLANTTQIYPQDRGMNYSVRLGEVAANLLSVEKPPVL